MAAFRLAGGVLLFLIALEMVFEKRTKRRNERAEEIQAEESDDIEDDTLSRHEVNDDIAAFPIAIPFVAGPGAIATVILLMSKPGADTLIAVTTRILGILLAALSIQFLIDGVQQAFGLVQASA